MTSYLHEVEAHGNEGHAEHQVHGTQHEAYIDGTPIGTGTIGSVPRNNISETNRAQRNEAKITTIQEIPTFIFGE